MSVTELNPLRRRLVEYMASFGLDASEIGYSDWSEEGFHLIRPGADRERVHPWPEGFNFDWFTRMHRAAHEDDARIAAKERGRRMWPV